MKPHCSSEWSKGIPACLKGKPHFWTPLATYFFSKKLPFQQAAEDSIWTTLLFAAGRQKKTEIEVRNRCPSKSLQLSSFYEKQCQDHPFRGIEGKWFIQDHITPLFERRDVSSASFPPILPFSWQAHRGRNLIGLFTGSCCFSWTLSTQQRTTLKSISHPPFAMFWGSLKFLWFCSEALTWQPCD